VEVSACRIYFSELHLFNTGEREGEALHELGLEAGESVSGVEIWKVCNVAVDVR
jgi:hypothetical protein